MNAVVLGFLILTVLSVFLVYYSKYKKHRSQQHTKEGFVGSEFIKTIIHNERQWKDVEILQKEGQITDKENDLAILLQNLEEIENRISVKEGELSQLRKDKTSNDKIYDFHEMTTIKGDCFFVVDLTQSKILHFCTE